MFKDDRSFPGIERLPYYLHNCSEHAAQEHARSSEGALIVLVFVMLETAFLINLTLSWRHGLSSSKHIHLDAL